MDISSCIYYCRVVFWFLLDLLIEGKARAVHIWEYWEAPPKMSMGLISTVCDCQAVVRKELQGGIARFEGYFLFPMSTENIKAFTFYFFPFCLYKEESQDGNDHIAVHRVRMQIELQRSKLANMQISVHS